MRTWAAIAALGGLISGGPLFAPAFAQGLESGNETLRVNAEAAPACVVRPVAASGAVNAVFTPDGQGGGTIAITQLVDPLTAEPRAASVDLALPVTCNAAHRLVIASADGGLLRAGGQAGNRLAPNRFADILPYSVDVDWGGANSGGSSDSGTIITLDRAATHGEMRLRVTTAPGGGVLTAGDYGDSITLRFEPAS